MKLGANCWNQYTDWPTCARPASGPIASASTRVWTWDHLYPIVGDHDGPILEGYMTLAAWAEATERADARA